MVDVIGKFERLTAATEHRELAEKKALIDSIKIECGYLESRMKTELSNFNRHERNWENK